MKYSILLPYYDPKYEKTVKFSQLIRSIVRNASSDDYEFVIVKDGPSYVESHNLALKNAKGDWLIIFNDDIEIKDKRFLEKLCIPKAIAAWKGCAHAWGMSREVFQKVGYFDERFKDGFNCEDTDYFHRAVLAGFTVDTVDISLTHESNNIDYADRSINRQVFFDKWGFYP